MNGDAYDEARFVRRFLSPTMLLLALAIDRWIGEPPARVHPVVWIGCSISALERRAPKGPRRELVYGAAMAAGSTVLSALAVRVLVGVIRPWPLRLVAGAWLLKTCFAYRALEEAGLSVVSPLTGGDVPAAREELRALVSRDRANLDEPQIAAATIESLAENLGDGFVAPLLAYALGGLPAAIFYRAANTADSMLGYRGRYEYFGKASARLDDVLNLVPARLAALALVAASGAKAGRAWRTLTRDHRLTQSPNAGWTISAIAGALGVALRKPGYYRINDEAQEPDAEDIHHALCLCRRAAILCGMGILAVTVLRGVLDGEA
jgi:adenosylcobinamide-phosphate synthase